MLFNAFLIKFYSTLIIKVYFWLKNLWRKHSNPAQVSQELNMCNLEKKYSKSTYVAQPSSDVYTGNPGSACTILWPLSSPALEQLHVSTSPIKPVSPERQKQSETFVSSKRPPRAHRTEQPRYTCLRSCGRRAKFLGLSLPREQWKQK